MADIKPSEVSAILKKQIEGFKTETELQEVGTVLQVGDGIARIYGLSEVQANEMIEFDNGTKGIILNLEEDNVGVVLFGDTEYVIDPITHNAEIKRKRIKKIRFLFGTGNAFILGGIYNGIGYYNQWLELIQIMCMIGIIKITNKETQIFYELNNA